ncbi:hypothetical protein TEA_020698 [Camellia sinensis var. sinensis]|uniref:RING-type E3 ubiquitin transferase n=1 Tax=Camellia sinensis var. sinensis TaxID=542762 RepID=A0A4S4EHT4_CAMSN|nr:hypothetical protein TEA_020698 [Camellia sinensis var. sinensis]
MKGQSERRVKARVSVATEAETRRAKERRVRARESFSGDGLGAVGIVRRFRAVWCIPLSQLLDTASKVLPLVVTITGRVGSNTPINCEHSGLRGVIVEEMAEQHFLKHNDAGSWIQDSALMLSMCKEVPWYLVRNGSIESLSLSGIDLPKYCISIVCCLECILLPKLKFPLYQDDGTAHVYVVGARGATGLVLTIGSELFEESGRSLVRGTLDYLQGLKMLGVKRTERVLPTGTPLTVVGEAVKDDIGTIRIQRPHKGPFYVSHKTIDQLIANLGKWARWYKVASVGFTVFGVYLLAKHAFHYIMERRRYWEMRKRVLAAAAKRPGQDSEGSDDKGENGSDSTKKDRFMPDLCVICLEQEYNSVFVPIQLVIGYLGYDFQMWSYVLHKSEGPRLLFHLGYGTPFCGIPCRAISSRVILPVQKLTWISS